MCPYFSNSFRKVNENAYFLKNKNKNVTFISYSCWETFENTYNRAKIS